MADVTKVKIGVCSVNYKGNDLGHTIGGVLVTYAPQYHDIQVDKYGKTTVEKILLGEKMTANVPLAEYTIANLEISMPNNAGNTTKITLGSQAGKKLLAGAGLLILHPIANAANDRSEDVVMYKAVQTGNITLDHKIDKEKVIPCVFETLLDETKSDGNYLGLIGDSTT